MAVVKKAPAGVRKVFSGLKEEINATKEPYAVAKALGPMLRDHIAKLKGKAIPANTARRTSAKKAAPAKRAIRGVKAKARPVRRRAAKESSAAAEAAE